MPRLGAAQHRDCRTLIARFPRSNSEQAHALRRPCFLVGLLGQPPQCFKLGLGVGL